MGHNYLWYRQGDAINVVLAAAGYNCSLLLRWLRLLLLRNLAAFTTGLQSAPT
jgi:IS5 family transposase